MTHHDSIEHRIIFKHIVNRYKTQAIQAVLEYRASEPYGVSLKFVDQPVLWEFTRDLLISGINEGSVNSHNGSDIHIWSARLGFTWMTYIHFQSNEGKALIYAPRRKIRQFLNATYNIVPVGSESYYFDSDEELRKLLSED